MPPRVKIVAYLIGVLGLLVGEEKILFAQKITFAEEVDSLGNLVNCKINHKIDPIKGGIVILAYQGTQAILRPKAYFFIDKKTATNSYKEFDNQKISITDSTQKTAYFSYLFTKEGNYRISFANAEKKIIISALLTVSFESNIVFCEKIDENELPENHTNQFAFKPNLEVYSFLKLSKPLNCNSISHQIYRYTGKNYTEQVFMGRFMVNPKWEYTYLKAHYENVGKYKVIIKSDIGKVLGMSYLEIK